MVIFKCFHGTYIGCANAACAIMALTVPDIARRARLHAYTAVQQVLQPASYK